MKKSDVGTLILLLLFACFNTIHPGVGVYVYMEVFNFTWGQARLQSKRTNKVSELNCAYEQKTVE